MHGDSLGSSHAIAYIAAVKLLPRSESSMISSDIARGLSIIREKDS